MNDWMKHLLVLLSFGWDTVRWLWLINRPCRVQRGLWVVFTYNIGVWDSSVNIVTGLIKIGRAKSNTTCVWLCCTYLYDCTIRSTTGWVRLKCYWDTFSQPRSRGSISRTVKKYFSSPQHPNWLWDQPSQLFSGYNGIKTQYHQADHTPPSCADIRNTGCWSFDFTSP